MEAPAGRGQGGAEAQGVRQAAAGGAGSRGAGTGGRGSGPQDVSKQAAIVWLRVICRAVKLERHASHVRRLDRHPHSETMAAGDAPTAASPPLLLSTVRAHAFHTSLPCCLTPCLPPARATGWTGCTRAAWRSGRRLTSAMRHRRRLLPPPPRRLPPARARPLAAPPPPPACPRSIRRTRRHRRMRCGSACTPTRSSPSSSRWAGLLACFVFTVAAKQFSTAAAAGHQHVGWC